MNDFEFDSTLTIYMEEAKRDKFKYKSLSLTVFFNNSLPSKSYISIFVINSFDEIINSSFVLKVIVVICSFACMGIDL